MNYKWIYDPPTPEEIKAADELGQEIGFDPLLAHMLRKRGVKDAEAAKSFFRPQLSDLHDPFLMKDMDKAVERLNRAIADNERIMIYGDYDVDGCTAVTLVYNFLKEYHSNLLYFIPSRYEEGYGITKGTVDYALSKGVDLIIILDCGTKAVKEIAYAKEGGLDFIVCDHHEPDDILPDAIAILNPKRKDNTYPYVELSGCGVGFKFMEAFAEENCIGFHRLLPLLEFCAISIACDMVSLMGENRILFTHGLRRLNAKPSIGMSALIGVCGLRDKEIVLSDIIFKIGPRINASGRLESGQEAVDLLIETDAQKACKMAKRINKHNDNRKDLDKKMTEEALQMVKEKKDFEEQRSIVVYKKGWNQGIVSIIASRLADLYYRPTLVLAVCEDGMAYGSARSVSGFNIYEALHSCSEFLESFGGHIYACGLTIKVENLPAFQKKFELFVKKHIRLEQTTPVLNIDAVLYFKDINRRLRKELRMLAPFGPQNPKPLFSTRHVYDYGTSKVVGRGQEHIKLELVDDKSRNVMSGIAFGQSSQARFIKSKHSFNICYYIEDNTHKRGEAQLQIVDIATVDK